MKIYWGCAFSMHARTTREIRKIKMHKKYLSFPEYVSPDDIPEQFPNNQTLLDMCRHLLYEITVIEEQWKLNQNAHTEFCIKTSALISKKMLCDRYDKKSFWICILNEKFEVIGVQRTLTSHLSDYPGDLDLLGYNNCPLELHAWVQSQKHDIGEIQRTVIDSKYRRMHFDGYINYLTAIYMLNPNYWGVNQIGLVTFPINNPHLMFMKLINSMEVQAWSFKYNDEDDFPVKVFIVSAKNIEIGIQNILNFKKGMSKR